MTTLLFRPRIRTSLFRPRNPPSTIQHLSSSALSLKYQSLIHGTSTKELAWDVATFFHNFENTVSTSDLTPQFGPEPGLVLPARFGNDATAQAYGFELSGSWQATDNWRLFGSYSFLRAETDGAPAPTDARNQAYVQSSWDVTDETQVDSILRYVDNQYGAPSYIAMDLRASWVPSDGVELFVVGRHLLDQEHDELVSDPIARTAGAQVEREVYGGIALRY